MDQIEFAKIELKIDGTAASAKLKELTIEFEYLTRAIKEMKKEEELNIPLYESRKKQVLNLVEAIKAERQAIVDETEAAGKFKQGMSALNGVMGAFGLTLGIGALVAFGKELFAIGTQASGIQNAFSKIGDTTGALDKLRTASRGLISDLDLEKIAIKANNANIPIEKMGTFLQFAQQRARDTGQNVNELTERLITGLGKNSPRALSGLGISVQEVKEDFKRTGDMVTTVSNIISRQMQKNGTDVDDFGEKVITMGTKWENLKLKAADFFQSWLSPELADHKMIEEQTNKEMKAFEGYQKYSREQLDKSIAEQQDRVQKIKVNYDKVQAAFNKLDANTGIKRLLNNSGAEAAAIKMAYKEDAEAYQGARNALSALNKEKEKYTVKNQVTGDGDAKAERAREKAARELQTYQNQLRAARDQLDSLIAKSTKGTIEGLDEQLKVIDDKYKSIVAKLKQLNQNKNASVADKKQNNNLIATAINADEEEQAMAKSEFNYKAWLKTINDDAKRQADKVKNDAEAGIIGKQKLEKQEYEIEQKRLQDLYDLEVWYGGDTVNIEKASADNELRQKQRVHDESLRLLKSQLQQEEDFLKAKKGIEDAKANLANSGIALLNDVFGKNKALLLAELALEKIIAIGKIEASEGVEIAGYFAKYALVPGGELIAAGLSAAAVTRANISIAEIVLSGIGEAIGDLSSGNSSGAKKMATGGLIPTGPSHAQGGINLVNTQTGHVIANMEGGEPVMVLSRETQQNNGALIHELLYNSMYKNGASVDVAAVSRGIQQARSGGVFYGDQSNATRNTVPATQGTGNGNNDRLDRMEAIMHDFISQQAKINEKPVTLSRRVSEQEDARVVQIRNAANAK